MSQENLSNSAGPSCLKRSFGMREAVTITAGSVIGVGLFTTGSNDSRKPRYRGNLRHLIGAIGKHLSCSSLRRNGGCTSICGRNLLICLAWTREGGRRFGRLEFHYFARCGYRR